MKTQNGSRSIVFSFFNLGAKWEWIVNVTPRPLYPGNDPVPFAQEAGWSPGPIWTVAENIFPNGV